MVDTGRGQSRVAIRSPLNWAVLGLLIERPSYGGELRARFERRCGDLLHMSGDSRIYKVLNELEKQGMIQPIDANPVSSGTERQPKRHYCVTAYGRESFHGYLVEEMRELRRRSQLHARLLAVLADRPMLALEVIDAIEDACVQEAISTQLPAPVFRSPTDSVLALAEDLAAEEYRLAMDPNLEFVRYARRLFKALAKDESPPR
jgi:DNA-binding PadR family transcriptional regulator